MPSPIDLLLDPVSLAVFAIYGLFMLWEALAPARTLPVVKGWRLLGLGAFALYFLVSSYLPLLWSEYLARLQLVDLTGLGTWGGALAGLLVYEAGVWCWHRLMHRSDVLWRVFHQMHHSAERLDTAGAFWFSPADMAGWTVLSSLCLTLVVGITPEAATLVLLATTLMSVFQHGNFRTPRWLGYLLQRPESHSLHHERGVHAGNYSDLPLFDLLFGTFRNPAGFAAHSGFHPGASYRVGSMLLFRDVSDDPAKRPALARAAGNAARAMAAGAAATALAMSPAAQPPAHAGEPAQDRMVRVNGIDLHYQMMGEGEPLLLLHFFSGCSGSWGPHLEPLARGRRLIAVDLRGHGKSTDPSGSFTHAQSARDVLGLLDHLGIARIQAMGMSSGGMTLLHMALQQPDRLEAMVLVGATTHFPEPARAIMTRTTWEGLSAAERSEWEACASRGEPQVRSLVDVFHRFKDDRIDMALTPDQLRGIRARTLIVHGDRDEFFPVDIAVDMYRNIPRAALWIVPNAGHLPILDKLAPVFRTEALAFLAPDWPQR